MTPIWTEMLPANMVPFYFGASWLGAELWEFHSGLCDKIMNTYTGQYRSLSHPLDKLHLDSVSRWAQYRLCDLVNSTIPNTDMDHSLPHISPRPSKVRHPLLISQYFPFSSIHSLSEKLLGICSVPSPMLNTFIRSERNTSHPEGANWKNKSATEETGFKQKF